MNPLLAKYYLLFFLVLFIYPLSGSSTMKDTPQSGSFDIDSLLFVDQQSKVDTTMQVDYDIQPIRNNEDNAWLFYILLVPIVMFMYIRFFHSKDLNALFKAYFNFNLSIQLYRVQEKPLTLMVLLLNIIFIMVFGMYLFFLTKYFSLHYPLGEIQLYLILVSGVGCIYIVKYIFIKFIAFIFPFGEELGFYNFHVFMSLRVMGLAYIPVVVVLAFAPDHIKELIIWPSIIGFFGITIYRYLRGINIGKRYILFKKFHFFIYLCTLEIIPIIVLFKWLLRGGFI